MAPSTSTPTSGGKAMSSRLLTMKFMQRAAASSPTTVSSPTSDEPLAKRRKIVDSSPSRSNVEALADQRAIQAAVAEEEAKRQAALERQGAEAGDTRWVLSFENGNNSSASAKSSLRIVEAGFANLDRPLPLHVKSTDSEDIFLDKPIVVGRKSFGKFNRVLEKQQNPLQDDSSDSESEGSENSGPEGGSDESEGDDPTGAKELINTSRHEATQRVKAERKAKRLAEKADSLELAKKRKKKDIKLNGLTSLTGRQDKADTRTCHKCGGLGHLQKDCSKTKRVHQDGDDGPPRKSRRSK